MICSPELSEKKKFDFNVRNEKGWSAIFYGKGALLGATGLVIMLIFISGFVAMPWETQPAYIAARGFVILAVLYCVTVYHRAITKISLDENAIYVKTWTKDRRFPTQDINGIKTTYYVSWGIALIRVQRGNRSSLYFLWAPTFERERYDLYLEMKTCMEKRFGGNTNK